MPPLRLLTIALLVTHIIALAFTITTAGLLCGWISDTHRFLSAFIFQYRKFKGFSVSIHGYPADVYITLIITALSGVVAIPLLIMSELINRFRLNIYFVIMEAVLSGLWLITAIIISTGAGMTDRSFAVRQVKPYSAYLYPEQQPYFRFLKKAARLGHAIEIFAYFNAIVWGCVVLLRFRVMKMMKRKMFNEHKGTMSVPYNMESSEMDEHADRVEDEDDSQSNVLTAHQLHELRLKKLQSVKDDEDEGEMLKFVEIQVPVRPKIELGEKFNMNSNDVRPFPAPVLSPPLPPPPPPKDESSANEVISARAPFASVGQESTDSSFRASAW